MTSRRSFACGLAVLPAAGAAGQALPPAATAAIDRAARSFLQDSEAAGLALGVTSPRGRHLESWGFADPASGRPVTSRTLFEIGSISKTFTAALAGIAVERGLMAWSDAPGRHVPEVRGPGTDSLTLADLATHATGGMPLQFPGALESWAEAAAWFRSWRPEGEPGLVRSYSNPSIGLLGVVAARAFGGDFAALMQRHVLHPLGLDQTRYRIGETDRPRYAQGQNRDGRPTRLTAGLLAPEAYGVRTTAPDLLRWVEAHLGLIPMPWRLRAALDGSRMGRLDMGVMTQAHVWEWLTPPVTEARLLESTGETMVFEPNRGRPLDPPQPPPPGALVHKTGSTSGFSAYAAFTPASRTGVVVLANRTSPASVRLTLAREVLGAVGG